MAKNSKQFWIVLRRATSTVLRTHDSEKDAREDAEAMATGTPGVEFVVMKSVASANTTHVSWDEHAGLVFGSPRIEWANATSSPYRGY